MAAKTTGDPTLDALYTVRRGRVAFVDVPELGFVMIDGHGAPDDAAFTNAIHALYSVSYGAHFALKKATGEAPAVMALEAVWWVEGTKAQRTMESIATGAAGMETSDRSEWHWRAMIMQLPPIDDRMIEQAIVDARTKKDLVALDTVRIERWKEGPSAQIMHLGPYGTEQVSVMALHRAIAEHGSRPRGRHHEIYLGDPRTSAPERLRTILRQPIEPVS
jgi:hypothetical protein